MNRNRKGVGVLLLMAVLLLSCHGLDSSAYAQAAIGAGRAGMTSAIALSVPAPVHSGLPEVECCFDGAGSKFLPVSLTRPSTLPAPLPAAPFSSFLLHAASQPVQWFLQVEYVHPTSLVAQSVLIRI